MTQSPRYGSWDPERRFSSPRSATLAAACVAGLLALCPAKSRAQQDCETWRADFIVVRGQVEVQAYDSRTWRSVGPGDTACRGDSVRTGAYSSALLRVRGRSLLRLEQRASVRLGEPGQSPRTIIEVVRGLLLFLGRDPRALGFATPYANAGLEGTELVLDVSADSTDITVLEGAVVMRGDSAQTNLEPGERGIARAETGPITRTAADLLERTRWLPYFAALDAGFEVAPDAEPTAAEAGSPAFYTARAESRVRRGAVDEAEADIATALRLDPTAAAPYALRAVIALRSEGKAAAHAYATRALAADPESVPALLALSYVAQAEFDLDAAAAALDEAARLDPENALVLARASEIALSRGDYRAAVEAATRAVQLDPRLGQARAMLGFAELAGADTRSALADFDRAIELDPGAPLPRVGRALALFREDRPEAARTEFETALILDPSNAAIRNYVAKVYYETDDAAYTESQLTLAAMLDPDDPTTYLYRALRLGFENRPVEAVQAFNEAAALNGNRPVFRAQQLRVDDDRGVGTVGLGYIFREAGAEPLALRAGWQATTYDRLDASGHRLLGDLAATQPRHEIARVSELYQAQLMQPPSAAPIPPQLGDSTDFLLEDFGPRGVASSEFVSLLSSDGLRAQGSAVTASNATRGYDVELAGLAGRVAFGAGAFDFESEGFRPNNDISREVANAWLQFQAGPGATVFTELRRSSAEFGSLALLFDPDKYSPQRQQEEVDSLRLGARRSLAGGGAFLGSLIVERQASEVRLPSLGFTAIDLTRDGFSLDLQYWKRFGPWQLTGGLYRLDQRETDAIYSSEADVAQTVAYAYADLTVNPRLVLTLGLSAYRGVRDASEASRLAPKLGLSFELTDRTTLRAGATEVVQGPLVSQFNVQPRLEPTHVAGFNQAYFGPEGEESSLAGIGLDHRFTDRLYAGVEVSERDAQFETVVDVFGLPQYDWSDRDESVRSAYLYWAANPRLSLSAQYRDEHVNVAGTSFVDAMRLLDTRRLPIEVNYSTRGRFRASARATFVEQSGEFSESMGFGQDVEFFPAKDSFLVVDLRLAYRLPNRRGYVSLGIDNLFDERFRFQDTDPMNPGIAYERMVALRFNLTN